MVNAYSISFSNPRDTLKIIEAFLAWRDAYRILSKNGKHNVRLYTKKVRRYSGYECDHTQLTTVAMWMTAHKYLKTRSYSNNLYEPTRKFIEWSLKCVYPKCCCCDSKHCPLLETGFVKRNKRVKTTIIHVTKTVTCYISIIREKTVTRYITVYVNNHIKDITKPINNATNTATPLT